MKRHRKFSMERLEERQMMAGDFATGAFVATELIRDRMIPVVPAVPAYSSNPGAPATLYLDFNGHFEAKWGDFTNVVTPVYSIDGDTTSFASYELAAIQEVWQRVAEDFAPFNINVTTVYPGNFDNGKALRVAIGGSSNDWLRESAGGIANLNSFTNVNPNTVYVFSQTAGPARIIADTVSHEAGHAFGLYHQSLVDANGKLVAEYAPGTSAKSPLMGYNANSERTTWWNGTTSHHFFDNYMVQDDMAEVASAKNGFGLRPDDFGNTRQTALDMGQLSYGPLWSQSGIIGTTSDTDWFQFNVTSNGRVSLQVDVAQVGANLDARLSLFRLEHFLTPSGKVQYNLIPVTTSDSATSLNASLFANVTPGTYYAVVGSHGEYGDVGQFTFKGAFGPPLTIRVPDIVVATSPSPAAAIAPTTTIVVQPVSVSSYQLNSSAQLLAAPMPSGETTSVLPIVSKSLATRTSLRAAAVDEALAVSAPMKSYMLADELFELIAAA